MVQDKTAVCDLLGTCILKGHPCGTIQECICNRSEPECGGYTVYRALAGSYFDSMDDLKVMIIDIMNDELNSHKLMYHVIPDCIRISAQMSCTI